jgi:riboflavin transporter
MTTTKKIALAAMMASIAVILTRFMSIIIPLGGYPSLSIDFGSVPIIISGIFLGPLYGGIVGLVSDLVGFIINNRGGVFHFGFTLNAILTGVIPGLLFYLLKNKNVKPTIYVLIATMFGLSLWYFLGMRVSDPLIAKIAATILIGAISLGLILLIKRIKNPLLGKVVFMTLIVEIFVYVALTPIWIYQLYQLPIFISVISRIFRALLLVPIKTILIYQSLKFLKI